MIRWAVVAIATVPIAMSCLVDRRSEELACDQDSDCDDIPGSARECSNGYCVLLECPSICDGGCTKDGVCTIQCNTANKCRDGVDCPNDFSCVFNCSHDCTPLECNDGCTVNCSSNAECGPIDCGAGETCTCVASGNGTCL